MITVRRGFLAGRRRVPSILKRHNETQWVRPFVSTVTLGHNGGAEDQKPNTIPNRNQTLPSPNLRVRYMRSEPLDLKVLAGTVPNNDDTDADRSETDFWLRGSTGTDTFSRPRTVRDLNRPTTPMLDALQKFERNTVSSMAAYMQAPKTFRYAADNTIGATLGNVNGNVIFNTSVGQFKLHPSNHIQFVSRASFSSSVQEDKRKKSTYSTTAKIPTPKSQPEQKGILPSSVDIKKFAEMALNATTSATKWLLLFILKLPGNLFYYMTHGEQRREKIAEIRAIAKKEFDHYWMGTKLLMADVRTARRLLGKTLTGSTLTRRERKQLLRTVSDLFRLVPFSMFLIIPFMEFALPFALRIFPNMLPSTFQDSLKAEENMKRELQSRIAMAQFFQDTLEELAKEQKRIAAKRKEKTAKEGGEEAEKDADSPQMIATKQEESAASMLEFLDRARRGEMLPPDVIVQYANYFQDDLTLDNMPRMQLINMCKYMSIPPYGSDPFLRFQLRHRIRSLKEDDQRILWEGIDSLTKMELREACQERGMRSTGMSKEAYKRALQQWLDLSVNKNVPISLLIMSRIFFLQEEMLTPSDSSETKSVAGLADAISGLDKEVLNEVILEVATSEEKKSDPEVRKIKLEVLTQQNELIREEQAEREAAAKKKESSGKSDSTEKNTAPESVESESNVADSSPMRDPLRVKFTKNEKQESTKNGKQDESTQKGQDEKQEKFLSADEMEAIEQLLSADPVSKERAELTAIKEAMREDGEDEKLQVVEKLEEMAAAIDALRTPPKVQPSADDEIKSDVEYNDNYAAETVAKIEKAAVEEADKYTKFSTEDSSSKESTSNEDTETDAEENVEEHEEEEEEAEDPVVARLKQRVRSMVDKIEVQLSDVEVKIGDKLHFLDKDMDGILTQDEMAQCLHQVLKREITLEEAKEIAVEMDGNEDGHFTVQELITWLKTNRLVKMEEEGRDAEMDRIMETSSDSSRKEEEEEPEGQDEEKGDEVSSPDKTDASSPSSRSS